MTYSWSYSAFSTALQCRHKFKLLYIDKITPPGPDAGDLLFGSALHSAINGLLTDQDAQALFEMYWGSYKDKEIAYGRYKWKELSELGHEFLRKFERLHAPHYRLQFAERRLYGQYKGVHLEGTFDYFGEYRGRNSLRDFKTSGANYLEEKSACALQLYLYAYLYLQNHPTARIDTLGYTVFNKAKTSIQDLTWEFKEEDMYFALDELVKYIDTWSHDVYPRNFNACLDYNKPCPFYSTCHKSKKT